MSCEGEVVEMGLFAPLLNGGDIKVEYLLLGLFGVEGRPRREPVTEMIQRMHAEVLRQLMKRANVAHGAACESM